MQMKSRLFLLPLLALLLSSCEWPYSSLSSSLASSSSLGSSPASSSSSSLISSPASSSSSSVSSIESESSLETDDIPYTFQYSSKFFLGEDGKPSLFTCDLVYNDAYFKTSGTTFIKELALMSYPSNYAAKTKEECSLFFDTLGYSSFFHSLDYDTPDSPETVKFNFAKKKVGDAYIVAANIYGLTYRLPWVNNFLLGKEGDAQGFVIGANKVISSLKEYLAQIPGKPKLWLTGYSRTAAIASLVAREVIEEGLIEEENMYCYTFEAPAVFDKTTLKPHPSIHNVINRGDIVTYLAPTEFGFTRAGEDVDTYVSNVDEILAGYDSRLVLPSFSDPYDIVEDDPSTAKFILSTLQRKAENPDDPQTVPDMSSRAHFVDNGYQDDFRYIIALVLTLPVKTLISIGVSAIKEGLSLLNENGLYNAIKPELDKANIEYDDTALANACNHIVAFLTSYALPLALMMLIPAYASDIIRTFLLHAPEVTFPLVLHYCR